MIPQPRASQGSEFLVRLEGVHYVYEGGVEAVRGVDLCVRRGEYIALVGGNGSGKTTLAKNLNGLLRPASGRIEIEGRDAASMTIAQLARLVGYVFQNPDHQLFSGTVEEEVGFGPRNLGFSDDDVASRVERALEVMDLQGVRSLPPLTLDLSHRRRVSIASVIAMAPELIVLDEPTTGLDAEDTGLLMDHIGALNRERHTLILITHDMRLVAEHAKRVLVMGDGQILLDSDPKGLFSDLEMLRRSSLEPPQVAQLAHRLSRFGVPADVLSPEELASVIARKVRGAQ